MTGIDPWFLDQMQQIVDLERRLAAEVSDWFGAPAEGTRRPGGGRAPPPGQTPGLLRQPPRPPREGPGGRGARASQGRRHPARLQARGHLRGRVRVTHALSLLDLRARGRGGAHQPEEGRDPGQRPQPHRAGHRVRLLLLPRLLRLQGGGLRDHHGQLQPGDGVHRLRHLRPALLRAPGLRGRDERPREGEARGGRDPVRRADARCAWPCPSTRPG